MQNLEAFEFYVVAAQAVVETAVVIFMLMLLVSHRPLLVRLREKWLVQEVLWRTATAWALACVAGAVLFAIGFRWYTAAAISLAHVVVLSLYVSFGVPYARVGRHRGRGSVHAARVKAR